METKLIRMGSNTGVVAWMSWAAFMHIQVEEDDTPLSHMLRPRTVAGHHPEDEQRKDVRQSITSPKSTYENMMGNFEQRLSAVEATVIGTSRGIEHIVSVMGDLKKHIIVNDVVPPGTTNATDLPSAQKIQNSCKCPQGSRKDSGPHLHAHKEPAGMGSQTNVKQTPPPQSDMHRGASFSDPVQVEDDASSQSVDVKPVRVQRGLATTIHTPLAARVHANPRQRVVPLYGKLPLARPPKVTKEPKTEPPKYRPIYKDPPGYEDVEDFGPTSETQYTGPVLKPRKSSVSESKPML